MNQHDEKVYNMIEERLEICLDEVNLSYDNFVLKPDLHMSIDDMVKIISVLEKYTKEK